MLRRTLAILATTGAVAIAAIAPADAEAPQLESYVAGAAGTALELSLLGQSLAFSTTSAGVSDPQDGEPMATANAAGALILGQSIPGAALSNAPEGPATAEQCPGSLDTGALSAEQLQLLKVTIACATSESSVEGGEPSAVGRAGEVTLTLQLPSGEVLDMLLDQILTPLAQGLATLNEALRGPWEMFLGALPTPVQLINVPGVVDVLVNALNDRDFVLAQISIAPSVSRAGADDTTGVVAESGTSGVVISLLPGLAAALDGIVGLDGTPDAFSPLLEVELGNALARIALDPVTGEPTPDASAAQILDLEVAPNTIGLLELIAGQALPQINDFALDQLGCNESNPLASVLCFDAGLVRDLTPEELTARGYNFGEGTVGREATAARLELLGIAGDFLAGSVLGLQFASADAAANAVPLQAAPPAPEAPASAPPALPRTGSDSTLPLTLAMLAVGAAGAMLLRRTRTS